MNAYAERFVAIANAAKPEVLEALRGKGMPRDARIDFADPCNPMLIFELEDGTEVRIVLAVYPGGWNH